jgi:hypothetical protein
MALLVVFFLIPWLEGGSLATGVDPESLLKLDMPWSLFYFVVVVTGLANHLPTRFAPGGLVLGCGYAGVFLALIQGVSSSAGQWAWNLFPLVTCAAVWLVCVLPAPPAQRSAFDRVWAWFRDRWGLVWAVRVQERFNREARVAARPVTLTWHGLVPHSGASETVDSETLEAATKSLKSLLRRFAEPGALERAAAHDAPDSIT